MPDRSSDACFYVEDEPIIEARDGMFHVTYAQGGWKFHVAMPPRVFRKALRHAVRIEREFKEGCGRNVVAFQKRSDRAVDAGH